MGQDCCPTDKGKFPETPLSTSPYDLDTSLPDLPKNMVRKKTTLLLKKLSQVEQELALEEKKESDWLKDQEEIIQEKEEAKDEHLDVHELIYLFQKCSLFYKNHDIDSACDTAKEVRTAKTSIIENRDLDEASFLQLLRSVEEEWQKNNPEQKIMPYSLDFIESLQAQMKDLLFYLNEVNKQPFFQKFNEDGVKISTRKDGNTIGTLIQCQLHVPFEYFTYILQEIPLLTDVLPYSEKSQLVKDFGRNSKLAYSLMNPPFVSRREAYFLGTAYFRFKHCGNMFIYTRSVHDNPQLKKKLAVQTPLNKDYVSLIYKYFVITYDPIKEGVGKLKFAYNVDNGVHFLPTFVEDYITRDFGKKFFYNILNACRNFEDSKWEESMIDNPGITVFAKEQIREHLGRMKSNQMREI